MEEKAEPETTQMDWLPEEWKKLEDKIREKPHQSVLIAFCAGLLVGALLKRRS